MKELVIVGAGGFAREALWVAQRCGIPVRGFLVDYPEMQGTRIHNLPVLGHINEWCSHDECDFVIAIGAPRGKASVHARMLSLGSPSFATLVDPSVLLGNNITVEPGSIICAGVICTTDIHIGKHVIININCTLGHDVQLGDFATVAPISAISGNVDIHTLAEIGTGAAIREKTVIGRGAVVGMGAVVTRDVPENTVVVGNPAKVLKQIPD